MSNNIEGVAELTSAVTRTSASIGSTAVTKPTSYSSIITGYSPILFRALSYVKIIVGVGVSLAAISLAALYKCQNHLVYPSNLNEGRTYHDTPASYGMDYQEVKIKTCDGEVLDCFALKHNPSEDSYTNKTIVLLGPNAGNMAHYLPIVEFFFKYYHYNVFVYSYRGYGRSTGSPSESGLKTDAKAVLNYLADDDQFSQSSIILYGRSLGGAVSIYMASLSSQYYEALSSEEEKEFTSVDSEQIISEVPDIELVDTRTFNVKKRKNTSELSLHSDISLATRSYSNSSNSDNKYEKSVTYIYPKISGLILENTFLSIPKVIPYIFPILKNFAGLCTQKWRSEEEILHISPDIPLLFLGGLKDEIVPPKHMEKLFELSKSSKKQFKVFKNGFHNNTCNQEDYWNTVYLFIKQQVKPVE